VGDVDDRGREQRGRALGVQSFRDQAAQHGVAGQGDAHHHLDVPPDRTSGPRSPRRLAVPDPAGQLTAARRRRCRLTVKLLARLDAGFDALGEADLVVFAQQGMAPNVVDS